MITGYLFKLFHLWTLPRSDIWWWPLKLKRVVQVLIECFLVCLVFKIVCPFFMCCLLQARGENMEAMAMYGKAFKLSPSLAKAYGN